MEKQTRKKELEVSRSTIWRWERESVIPPHRKLGRVIYGRESELIQKLHGGDL